MSDQSFVLWLHQHLSSSPSSPPEEEAYSFSVDAILNGHLPPASQKAEILDIVWCYVQPLSEPCSLLSCCAILTSSTIFVEKLTTTQSTFNGMPGLEPMFILPLKNVQQMVVGPCHSFLRLEEAFVGKCGTFTLFCLEPLGIQRFSQRLLSMCQQLNYASDLECVDLSSDSDLLKRIVAHEETLTGFASDRLVLMILVEFYGGDDNDSGGDDDDAHKFHFLLLSENSVYCISLLCALWPPPCFESLPRTSLHFKVIHEFSIADKLVDLKIHPEREVEEDDKRTSGISTRSDTDTTDTTDTPAGSLSVVHFSNYQLSLIIEAKNEKSGLMLPSSSQTKERLTYKYNFPSSALRDQFLDRLSNLRAELANRMSPNVREAPEGGNEQPSDSVDTTVKANRNNSNANAKGCHVWREVQECPVDELDPEVDPPASSYFTPSSDGSKQSSLDQVDPPAPSSAPSYCIPPSSAPSFLIPSSGGSKQCPVDELDPCTPSSAPSYFIPPSDGSDHSQGDVPVVAESFRSFHSSSSASFQSIVESEGADHQGQRDDGSTSTSPKEEILSVSPTSNFSRASISPPAHQGEGEVSSSAVATENIETQSGHHGVKTGGRNLPQATHKQRYQQPDFSSNTGSLPSSFDWKTFYFPTPDSSAADAAEKEQLLGRANRASKAELNLKGMSSTSTSSDYFPSDNLTSAQTLPSSRLQLNVEAASRYSFAVHEIDSPSSQNETELDRYLKKCVSSIDLIFPLSTKLKPLCLMSGSELRKFFQTTIAPSSSHLDVNVGGLAEELHHVLWAMVVPYTNPKQEILTLIMLSTYAVYLVSDTGVKVSQTSRPSWMTHSRNQSDSAIAWTSGGEEPQSAKRKVVAPFLVLKYKDLHQIHVGLFDQCVRLTGHNENAVFTIATRDSRLTEVLVEKLKQVLSLSVSSPMLERSHQEMEQDFYRDVSQRTKTTVEGLVYTHPSQVGFVYPGEDAVRDVLYLIKERVSADLRISCVPVADRSPSLWLYIQCYLLPTDDSVSSVSSPPSSSFSTSSSGTQTQPRTILVTSTHFAVAEEDVVTYPLPDFVRGLPENPCHKILDCRAIDTLKRVHLYHGNPHWLGLTFVEEKPELVVDVNMQHFSDTSSAASAGGRQKKKVAPEINLKFYIQSVVERDKLVQMLEKLWKQQVAQVGRILDVQKV